MRNHAQGLAQFARPLIVAALATGTSAVWSEPQPYYIGLRQGFSHNTNLFKSPDGSTTDPVVSDVYSSTALLGGIDQPLGRQRFFLDGAVAVDRYEDVKELDNESYRLTTGLDWQTVDNLAGTLRLSSLQSLADYGGTDSIRIREKNMQTTNQAVFDARYSVTRRLAFYGGYEYRSVAYSADAYASQEYTRNVGSFGIRYGLPELVTWGLGVRYTKGNTPHAVIGGTPEEDDSERRDIDLTLSWMPSALSTLRARLSSSEETHSQPTYADESGWTGALSWAYRPTAKLNFDLWLMRDTGDETTFALVSGTPSGEGGTPPTLTAYDENRLTYSSRLGVGYELTSKIRLTAGAGRSKTTSESSVPSDNDNVVTTHYAAGIRYEATRSISLGCNYIREEQDDRGATPQTYSANLTTCYGQITLR